MKEWASAAYLRIAFDPADVRKLLASDDAGVLGNVLRRIKGEEVDEDLLKRLVELTAYKTKEPHAQSLPRILAADVMAADPTGRFAARKVEAILAAVADVANMPDAGEVQKLSLGTNAEMCYYRYMRALAEMHGADEALRRAGARAAPLARDLLAIARAQRNDAAARKDLYPILNDPQAGLRRAWAAQGLAVVGTRDDLPLLKKLADSDPLERQRMDDGWLPGEKNTYFPVREAARQAAREIESRQKPANPADKVPTAAGQPPPTALVQQDRPHYLIHGDTITFDASAIDADLAVLDKHPELKTVDLGGSGEWDGPDPRLFPIKITDVGFAHIANCKNLETLRFGFIQPHQVWST
jgi:hypothetical protein